MVLSLCEDGMEHRAGGMASDEGMEHGAGGMEPGAGGMEPMAFVFTLLKNRFFNQQRNHLN